MTEIHPSRWSGCVAGGSTVKPHKRHEAEQAVADALHYPLFPPGDLQMEGTQWRVSTKRSQSGWSLTMWSLTCSPVSTPSIYGMQRSEDEMPWFQVDDQLGFHPKAVAAGNAAMGLWVRAGSWCSLHVTEGFVPANIARSMGTPAQIRRLVEVGLWVTAPNGYDFHQWDDRQMSKGEIEDRRRKRADAGRKGGQKSGVTRRSGSKQGSKIEASASANAEARPQQELQQNRTPVLVPALDSGYLGGEALDANVRENAPPPRSCAEHPDGFVPDCGRCQELDRERTTWLAGQVAQEFAAAGRCAKHRDVENPPDCGACGDSRKLRDRKQGEHARRLATAKSNEAHQAAADRAAAIRHCVLCDADGYRNGRVCSHDPDEDDRTKRGIELARAALIKPKPEAADG